VSLETAGGTYVRVKVRCSKLLLKYCILLVQKKKHMHQPVVPKTVKQGEGSAGRAVFSSSHAAKAGCGPKGARLLPPPPPIQRAKQKKVTSLSGRRLQQNQASELAIFLLAVAIQGRHSLHPAASSGAMHRPVRASHSHVSSPQSRGKLFCYP
jgi:hypothetical protein